jgi:uncharacterized protein involved in response to NO
VVLFALGFRPFFLAAGFSAVALVSLWLGIWSGFFQAPAYYGVLTWHAHEMLFGYTAAVVAGFLLTAVKNWTGKDTWRGNSLAILVLVWLLGRVVPWLPGLPAPILAAVDLSFLPALAFSLCKPLCTSQPRVNRLFIPILLAMALANLLVHLDLLGLAPGWKALAMDGMLNLLVLLALLLTGRVLPFFTERAVSGSRPVHRRPVEALTYSAWAGLTLAELFALPAHWAGGMALALAILQVVRVVGWHDLRVWKVPILAVLYGGSLWLAVGFGLKALVPWGLVPPNLALHALTVGGIGVLTLGMMARVSLGHTGRAMRSSGWVNTAFVLLNLGAAVRVFGPLLASSAYSTWVLGSGTLWIAAFLLFTAVYAPILWRPRVDGQAG